MGRSWRRVPVRSSDELLIRAGRVWAPRHSGVLALIGLICAALSVIVLAQLDQPTGPQGPPASVPLSMDVFATVPEEPLERLTSASSYLPGQDSGWHSHPGLHLVEVLEGTLTVYDADCNRAVFGPGQAYGGGDRVHLARNETDSALEMSVTYLPNPDASLSHFRIDEPPPSGCESEVARPPSATPAKTDNDEWR